ncbi:rCG37459 [Rattus norvegicus]|uniref:RCG37459 n=1 Tax=Rattus norvegicus TaxID=10116 RepID=A6KHV9_RAT|nr:rCG37459 [Rattus norvegicus]
MSGPEREELLLESHRISFSTTPLLQGWPGRCDGPAGHPLGTPYCFLLSPSLAFVSHLEGKEGLGGRKSIHVPPTTWVPGPS